MTFGESLTSIRKGKGISRKDFAEQLQIPYTTLRNYETNQREPGHKLLIKMATLLQVSVDELIGYQVQDEKKELPIVSDEERLDKELIARLCRLTPEEAEKVDAFVQGILASR